VGGFIKGQLMIKRTFVSIITILAFVAFAFAQPSTTSPDSLKASQNSETQKLAKKTIVNNPLKTSTNWSKIKDLFR